MTTKEHLARHDREIAAIRKLILTGMKMLNTLTVSHQQLADSQRRLSDSQRETDKQLQALIRSLQRGTNGHSKRSIGH